MNDLQASHHISGVPATEHQTKALGDLKQAQAVGDHERSVETQVPKWLQPLTEGLTRRCSRSTDVSQADVEMPLPAIPPSTHPHAKTYFKQRQEGNLFNHFPKYPNREVCRRTKVTRAPCKINADDWADRNKIAERFGNTITADLKVLDEGQESRLHHRCAVVVQYLATLWNQSHRCKTKSAQETQRSLRTFSRPLEFIEACEELIWNHERSTPHRSETNGIAERAVRRVKEAAMECYCYLRNVQDKADGQQFYECRFTSPFEDPIFPCGAESKNNPILSKDQGRVHQFGTKVFLVIFMRYALNAGRSWTGDLLTVDSEDINNSICGSRKKLHIKRCGHSQEKQ